MFFLFIGNTTIAQILGLTAAGANLKNDPPRVMRGTGNPAQISILKFIIDTYNETKIIFTGDTHMHNGIKDYGRDHMKEFAGAGGSAPYTSRNDIDTGKVTVRTNPTYQEILKPRAN
jgi:hypothetical protein